MNGHQELSQRGRTFLDAVKEEGITEDAATFAAIGSIYAYLLKDSDNALEKELLDFVRQTLAAEHGPTLGQFLSELYENSSAKESGDIARYLRQNVIHVEVGAALKPVETESRLSSPLRKETLPSPLLS